MHRSCHSHSKGTIHKIEKLFNRNELGARGRDRSKVQAVLECRGQLASMMLNSIVHSQTILEQSYQETQAIVLQTF